MIWPFRKKSKGKRQITKRRIFISAALFCAFVGFIGLTEPLEDYFRGARNFVRERPADGSVVVVAIDDKTVAALKSGDYSRRFDAIAVDRLLNLGAKKIYYDRAFSEAGDPDGDAAFERTLARHPGKVALGALTSRNETSDEPVQFLPTEQLRKHVQVRSLNGKVTPFRLSAELGYADKVEGVVEPSISSDIAGVTGPVGQTYRPDWSIQVKTIPTISFLDVIEGRVSKEQVEGKFILIGLTNGMSPDFAQVIPQGWFAGVYVHAVGAQTLLEGRPRSIGWELPYLLGLVLSGLLMRVRSSAAANRIVIVAISAAVALPFILDINFIRAEFLPGILVFGVIAFRLATNRELNEARRRNAETLFPNLAALREEPQAAGRPIIAMRIRNYAAISASFAESIEEQLVLEVARRLDLPGNNTTFYQAEDVLYWLGPALTNEQLESHLTGLARLIESQFIINGRKIDLHVAFGVDVDVARPVASRIGRALLAADNAAARHQLLQFNTSGNDEDSAWELSLMSELDAAIDNGDIWVAYQPQFNLTDNSISGAESLVRWQHPTRGAISPEAFVLAAEMHNRMARLTFYVLEMATNAAKPIVESHPAFRLSVNVSANLLEQVGLTARITEILNRTGFPARNLTLEVTESAPFGENASVAANLAAIAAIGIDLSIDDYGTGNATLDYLRSVPCQEVKIDRRFVANITTNESDLLLVESTIELAHGLGRRIIAEGIEDPETLELLRGIGCDTAQGYYLAKPMRIEALESLMHTTRRIRAA